MREYEGKKASLVTKIIPAILGTVQRCSKEILVVVLIHLRLAPTAHPKPPPTLRRGGFGGSERSNGSLHSSPYMWGELKLPPHIE